MLTTRRLALGLMQAMALVSLPALAQAPAGGEPPVRLYKVVTTRGEVLLGSTPRELAAMGPGPEVERIARRISQDGQFTAWRYEVMRAPDGSTRLGARVRVAVLRQDSLMVEPYSPALPVTAPPSE